MQAAGQAVRRCRQARSHAAPWAVTGAPPVADPQATASVPCWGIRMHGFMLFYACCFPTRFSCVRRSTGVKRQRRGMSGRTSSAATSTPFPPRLPPACKLSVAVKPSCCISRCPGTGERPCATICCQSNGHSLEGPSRDAEPRPISYADLGGIDHVLADIRELIENPLQVYYKIKRWSIAHAICAPCGHMCNMCSCASFSD